MSQPLFVRRAGLKTGPHPWRELKTMIRRVELSRIHEVSVDGKTWVYATEYPQLFDPNAEEEDVQLATEGAPGDSGRKPPSSSKDSDSGPSPSRDSPWWYEANGEPAGPVSLDTLRGMLSDGSFSMDDRVWTKGMDDWEPPRSIPGFGDGSGTD